VEQFFFLVHGRNVLEFLLRVRLRRLLGVIEFGKNFAGNKHVPCAQESIQRLEDVVNGAIVQIAFMGTQELHIPQKLRAIDLIQVAQFVLRSEVEKEAKALVVRPQCLLALALLILALKNLKLG
jgi:hypothetical protein